MSFSFAVRGKFSVSAAVIWLRFILRPIPFDIILKPKAWGMAQRAGIVRVGFSFRHIGQHVVHTETQFRERRRPMLDNRICNFVFISLFTGMD